MEIVQGKTKFFFFKQRGQEPNLIKFKNVRHTNDCLPYSSSIVFFAFVSITEIFITITISQNIKNVFHLFRTFIALKMHLILVK